MIEFIKNNFFWILPVIVTIAAALVPLTYRKHETHGCDKDAKAMQKEGLNALGIWSKWLVGVQSVFLGIIGSGNGGGLYVAGGSASILGCSFSGNTAAGSGGDLFLYGGTVTIGADSAGTNTSITGNKAGDSGGGMASVDTLEMLSGVDISGNTRGTGTGAGEYRDSATVVNLGPGGVNDSDGVNN